MYSVLVTGANRGIGLEFVKQYAQAQYRVYATYLPSGEQEELQRLSQTYSQIVLIPMDVRDESQIKAVAQQLASESIDLLINNAGVFGDLQDLEDMTQEVMLEVFKVNAVGPLLVAKHFVEHVARSSLKTIIAISSRQGSISSILSEGPESGLLFSYRPSKTALNMIMAQVALHIYDRDIRVLLFHPGHVKTVIGGPHAKIDTFTSVQGMRKVIEWAPRSLEQFYYWYDGTPLEW